MVRRHRACAWRRRRNESVLMSTCRHPERLGTRWHAFRHALARDANRLQGFDAKGLMPLARIGTRYSQLTHVRGRARTRTQERSRVQ